MPQHPGTLPTLLAAGLALSAALACAQAVRPEPRVGQSGGAARGYQASAQPAQPAAPAAAIAAPAAASSEAGGGNIETLVPTSRVSSGVASAITAGLPKYQAPKPPEPAPTPQPQRRRDPGEEEIEEAGGDESANPAQMASDQPRNKIIRLPKYVVEADRPPIFKEREILTKQALAELAVRRYLSRFDSKVLNRFTLPIIGVSPEARAMAMYEEDVRLENISELKDAAESARRAGDRSGSNYILKETDRTFLRSGGMDWTSRRD